MLTEQHPEIEWEKIASIGNVLRHEYQRVDPETMWNIATVKLPELEAAVKEMLAALRD